MKNRNLMLEAAAIAAVLRANDIARAVVEYAGDGDEGGVDAFRFFNAADEETPEGEVPDVEVTLPGDFDASRLTDALDYLLDQALAEIDQSNYEDGEGGLGKLHLHADGTFRLEHEVRETVYRSHTHYFH